MKNMIQYINDKIITEWRIGMKVIEKYLEEINKAKEEGRNIIACMCNNEVRSLNYDVQENDNVQLLDTTTKDGHRIYVRGIIYIMAKALNKLYPKALLSINYHLSNSMFCQIDNMEVTEEFVQKLKEKMQEIIDKDLEIRKVIMTKEEAEEFYAHEKTLRGIAQVDNKQKETVSLYYCEEYYNYFYGVMPITTGYTNVYDVSTYQDGFLVRYPSKEKPNELAEYRDNKKLLSTLEEYEDIHRVLNIHTLYKFNKEVKEGKTRDLILLSEALHEKKIAGIADDIAKNKNIKMVLIAGPSSSGKTTFAKRLGIELRLNGLKPVTISVDNYFVERKDTPRDENGNYDFERLEAIDLNLFNDHIKKLLNGETIEVPTFDFKVGTKIFDGTTMDLADDEILVIEGIHCLNDKLTSAIPTEQKYKIYISDLTVLNIDYCNRISTTDTRLLRRIVRDNNFRGYSALHTLRNWDSVNRGENRNIFPFQENCNVMFNSSLVYEISVLKKHALPLLEEITNKEPEYSEAKRLVEFLKYFEDIDEEFIPRNSLLREFIGGSIFEY